MKTVAVFLLLVNLVTSQPAGMEHQQRLRKHGVVIPAGNAEETKAIERAVGQKANVVSTIDQIKKMAECMGAEEVSPEHFLLTKSETRKFVDPATGVVKETAAAALNSYVQGKIEEAFEPYREAMQDKTGKKAAKEAAKSLAGTVASKTLGHTAATAVTMSLCIIPGVHLIGIPLLLVYTGVEYAVSYATSAGVNTIAEKTIADFCEKWKKSSTAPKTPVTGKAVAQPKAIENR